MLDEEAQAPCLAMASHTLWWPSDGAVRGTAGADQITGIQIDEIILALAGDDAVQAAGAATGSTAKVTLTGSSARLGLTP